MSQDYHRQRVHILLVLLAPYLAETLASTVPQCLENVISCAGNSSSLACTSSLNISSATALSVLRTSNGSFIPPELDSIQGANALSYAGCLEYCGTGSQEPFTWDDFSQEYATWLLPYLSLLSQLPFGARRRTDNLMSAILTLGSPTLAGYSLFLTLLNARWVNDHVFAGIQYPTAAVRDAVVRVLGNLQSVPLRVHPGEGAQFESLVVHPDNDGWWMTFAKDLEYSRMWSIASATSIVWVLLAYSLSVANAISNLTDNYRNGEGTASGLLWLLPIVVGWLILSPKCNYERVLDAYNKANRLAVVADSNGDTTPAPSDFGLTISPPPWEPRTNTISPDESRIPPIFNYARLWPWAQNVYVTSLFYRAASERWNRRTGANGVGISGNVCGRCSDVPQECRLRNKDEIILYCRPRGHEYPGVSVLWPQGILFNMIIASLMGLQLQWGTTSAALLGAWFTPTVGLGCRSLVYLLYGVLSTTVWILLVLSSMIGYYAHHLLENTPDFKAEPTETRRSSSSGSRDDGHSIPLIERLTPGSDTCNPNSDGSTSFARTEHARAVRRSAQTLVQLANWMRWIGKTIAVFNAIGSLANALFEYAGVYGTCFCDGSVFSWGLGTHVVYAPSSSDYALLERAWYVGLGLALSSCGVFVGSIFLLKDSLLS